MSILCNSQLQSIIDDSIILISLPFGCKSRVNYTRNNHTNTNKFDKEDLSHCSADSDDRKYNILSSFSSSPEPDVYCVLLVIHTEPDVVK